MIDKEKNRLLWEKRVKDFVKSNESMNKWCKENNIKPTTFRYWVKKYQNQEKTANDKSQEWIPVSSDKIIDKNRNTISNNSSEITMKIGEIELLLSPNFDKNVLKNILEVLGVIC